MVMKILIVVMLFLVAFSLFRALYFLVINNGDKSAVVKALGWRVACSVVLLLLLVVASAAGLIEPHGLSVQS